MIGRKSLNNKFGLKGLRFLAFIFAFCALHSILICFAKDNGARQQSIIINGDVVNYSTDNKEVSVTGNALVDYQGTKLTCQRLIVNTETKNAQAQGDARIEDEKGTIEGSRLIYNFQSGTGTIFEPKFRFTPYFGTAETMERVSEDEFDINRSALGTCSFNKPHYLIKTKKTKFFPGDKIQTKDTTFYFGKIPAFYLPQYSHSLRDPMAHVQLLPGSSKDWGGYLLTASRYNLTEDLTGRIYVDYRNRLGFAEGLGINYASSEVGKGDFKFYYAQERSTRLEKDRTPYKFQRRFFRLRHQWDIDLQTNITAEFYRIIDPKQAQAGAVNAKAYNYNSSNFLKDYFYREFEKDEQPLTYATLHHSFSNSNFDLRFQKRVNNWYSQAEMLPEVKYSLPSVQIFESPFYFEDNSSYVNYDYKNSASSGVGNTVHYNQWDTYNKISLPFKAAFFNLNPFFANQENLQDREGIYGSTLQVNFSAGSDISTKFYRLFNIDTNLLGLNLHGLRHIITPTATYTYNKNSTMPSEKLRIGGGAANNNGSLALELSNKLQTKRKEGKVDIADFRVNTSYSIKPKTGAKRGSSFQDFLFNLELRPYSWLSVVSDATLVHSGARDGENYGKFSQVNYDIDFNIAPERTLGIGQRYQRKGANEITYQLDWRLTPKWKFKLYQRLSRGYGAGIKRGILEQEYVITRDLHCWEMAFTYNSKVGNGESVWLLFRLKAFPELEFDYNQSYNKPKPGSQTP